jgi:hypothetical protein
MPFGMAVCFFRFGGTEERAPWRWYRAMRMVRWSHNLSRAWVTRRCAGHPHGEVVPPRDKWSQLFEKERLLP